MKLIQHITVGSGGAASITFSSIPGTFTDLRIVFSGRNADAVNVYALRVRFNSNASGYTQRLLYANSGTVESITRSDDFALYVQGANATANTFSNSEIYIPNYSSSANKSFSVDYVNENNSATNLNGITAGLWSNTAAITSVALITEAGNLVQHSSATLYGILRGSDGITTAT